MKFFLAVVLALLLSGCTSNPTLLKFFYGQFDNVLAREILDYADFSDEQEQQIREAVDKTTRWHRTQALTDYVKLVSEAESRLLDRAPSKADIDWLFDSTARLGREFEAQSPLLTLRTMIASLSDEQIAQVNAKINEEFEEQEEDIKDRADEDPAQQSTKNLSKFFKRLGLKLTRQQQAMARTYFSKRRLSESDRLVAWRAWGNELKGILQSRTTDGFAQRFADHYTGRATVVERAYPTLWQQDQSLNKAMLLELFTGLSEKQKQSMRDRLASLSGVASDLASE